VHGETGRIDDLRFPRYNRLVNAGRLFLLIVLAFAMVTGAACPLSICGVVAEASSACGHCCPVESNSCCDAEAGAAEGALPLAGAVQSSDLQIETPVRELLDFEEAALAIPSAFRQWEVAPEPQVPLLDLNCILLI
jgi:hypothetical protein